MPRPKSAILPEATRQCLGCRLILELTRENFGPHASCRGGINSRCRRCARQARRLSGKHLHAARLRAAAPLKPGQRCPECYGLAHRVTGLRCWRCQLLHAPEPPVELVFRLYSELSV